MKVSLLCFAILALAACSQQQTDDTYWCSYETDPVAYQNCLEVGRELDETTAKSAGKQVAPPK